MANYEIGGVHVSMSKKQADRWNSGSTTASDLRQARVFIPEIDGYREISLQRACNARLEPQTASVLAECFSANPV